MIFRVNQIVKIMDSGLSKIMPIHTHLEVRILFKALSYKIYDNLA